MRQCTNKDVGPQRGWIWEVPYRLENGASANKGTRPQRGWNMRSHLGKGGEQNILYMSVETSP